MVTKKKTAKKASRIPGKIPGKGPHPLYGRPIEQAIARGNLAEMRRLATQARKYLKDVTGALGQLDRKIKAG